VQSHLYHTLILSCRDCRLFHSYSSQQSCHPSPLHPFPTRRSSDLATAETKAQGDGGFWFKGQRGIVKLELLQGITQIREISLGNWEKSRIHHRLWIRITRQRLIRALGCPRDRVADLGLTHVLHASDEIAHLTRTEPLHRCRSG